MNNANLLLSQNPNFKFVEVKFREEISKNIMPSLDGESSKSYTYKTTLDVKEDDLVIVHTPSGEYKVVRVVSVKELHDVDNSFEYKWVVSKVDLDYYESCKRTESEIKKAVNRMTFDKQREEYKAQLQERLGKEAVLTLEGLVRL